MLHQLSHLSTPFTLIPLSQDVDVAALKRAAPDAVVRGGATTAWASANRNRVFVLDRCGRLVYQQSILQEDADFESVEAAILSAGYDDPCGPCRIKSQVSSLEIPGGLDDIEQSKPDTKETPSVAKSIASAYKPSNAASAREASNVVSAREASNVVSAYKSSNAASAHEPSNVAKPTERTRLADENDRLGSGHVPHSTTLATPEENVTDNKENEEEILLEPTKKPERKKNNRKGKKGRNGKQKKRKRLEEGKTTTTKPVGSEADDCACRTEPQKQVDADAAPEASSEHRCPCMTSPSPSVDVGPPVIDGSRRERFNVDQATKEGQDLVRLLDQLNEILHPQTHHHTADATTATVPRPRMAWPTDSQPINKYKKNRNRPRNSKQQQKNIQQDINEGIEMVTEDEEFIEYPDKIDAFIRTEENVLTEVDDFDEDLMGQETSYRVNQQRREEVDVTFTAGNGQDEDDDLNKDISEDDIVNPAVVYVTPPEEDSLQARDERRVWGTYKRDESKDEYDGKKTPKNEKKLKGISKKGKKVDGEYKKERKVGSNSMRELEEEELEHTMGDAMDAWATSDETESQEYVLRRPSAQEPAEDAGNRFVTWKEVTLSPQAYDSKSSGEVEDHRRRLVLYASDYEAPSADEDPMSEKVTLLHSKVHPLKHNKH